MVGPRLSSASATLSLLGDHHWFYQPHHRLKRCLAKGVMESPATSPGCWVFIYRISPLIYLVSGIASTGLHARAVACAENEFARCTPPAGQTCGQCLAPCLASPAGAVGQLLTPERREKCRYCPYRVSDEVLGLSGIIHERRWRNFRLGFVYIFFNIVVVVGLSHVFRVRNWSKH